MAGTRSPSQDNAMIWTRRIQSTGACRAPASLRILRSSTASTGGRANSSFGMVDHHHGTNLGSLFNPSLRNGALGRSHRPDPAATSGGVQPSAPAMPPRRPSPGSRSDTAGASDQGTAETRPSPPRASLGPGPDSAVAVG